MICKQCGKPFELTDSEIRFYESKGLNQPRRCEACRRNNRKQNESAEMAKIKIYHLNGNRPKYIIIFMLVVILIIAVFLLLKYQKVQNQEEIPEQIVVVRETVATETTESIIEVIPETTETAVPETEESTAQKQTEITTEKPQVTYYLNTYRMKFHRPDCPSISEMNIRNRQAFYGTRQEAIDMGYSPCNNCKP